MSSAMIPMIQCTINLLHPVSTMIVDLAGDAMMLNCPLPSFPLTPQQIPLVICKL